MNQDDQLITDRTGICNLLNQFFFSVFDPPAPRTNVEQARETFIARARPDPAYTLDDIVTTAMVLRKLKSLNSDKTAGADQVPTHALKMCAEALAGPLAQIFRRSLESSSLPIE